MSIVNEMRLDFLACPQNEGFARLAVSAFILPLNPTLEQLGDVKTSVSEAVTNAIVHAYPDALGSIQIRCRVLPGSVLEIIVRDRGCGIEDLGKAMQPMFTTGSEERSGMGFTIMESFMTSLRVKSRPGKGTAVHMRRKIVNRGENR